MSSAGGIFYHWRALHSAGSRWKPFRDGVSHWLAEWPATDALVVVGPSAAYCVDDLFFTRFRSLTLLEPDPIARFMLSRRLARLGLGDVRFVTTDHLVAPLLEGTPGLDTLLHAAPGASVLFSNILGQLPYLVRDADRDKWQRAWTDRVAPELRRRPFASFHDRVSSTTRPSDLPYAAEERLTDAELGARFFGTARGRVELQSHEAGDLFPASLPHAYFHWEIEPGAHHVIEAVRAP